MIGTRTFTPNWVSPPGDTITEILREKKISITDFANRTGLTERQAKNLLSGGKKVTPQIAEQLQNSVGSTSNFWLKRESLFRERLSVLQSRRTSSNDSELLKELPINELVRLGWIEKKLTIEQQVKVCLSFFGVSDIESWRNRYVEKLNEAAFRTSPTFVSQFGAVAAWLRQGEIEGNSIECYPWSAAKFADTILQIRSLTREKKPDVFIPELKKRCARCGVAVVIIRAPKGCSASGASLFLAPYKALIILSLRYISDDHFWYTFFHEAAHLILHGKKDLFVDGDGVLPSKEEEEANEFAADILIPTKFLDQLSKLGTNGRDVVRFAKKVGVGPGIIVGQLQHRGRIEHHQLNNLKIRYTWYND